MKSLSQTQLQRSAGVMVSAPESPSLRDGAKTSSQKMHRRARSGSFNQSNANRTMEKIKVQLILKSKGGLSIKKILDKLEGICFLNNRLKSFWCDSRESTNITNTNFS